MLVHAEKSMMRFNRLIPLLAVLLLSAVFITMVHYHDDGSEHRDCPSCLVSRHQHATGQTALAFDGVPFLLETRSVTSAPFIAEKIITSFQSDRAPPA